MGIPGIYKEIGPGERISLCKLAVEHLERTGRPFRLAIDISIWQFQAQAAKGGANPAIRTLFYRLVRLLSHAIEPLFVFDGPNKPAVKRNKRSNGAHGDVVGNALTKRLIRLFGFATHDAPGEAEAECALLQQQGIVDAVLSEDVDTIMFGCRRTLRAWTGEGKAAKTPTHVTMYDLTTGGQGGTSGLDREGMVLVALMSGGDYLPSGVQGFGVKVACEAAKAGFGRDLCRIKRNGYKEALAEWRGRLLHELRTNESGFFRTKHKALEIPEEFPGMEILRYYTHPVVSRQETVDRLRKTFPAKLAVDVDGLRVFVRDTFDWAFRIGAVKYIRVLAPGLLVQFLLQRSADEALRGEESALVRAISTKRAHPSTDATPELRISYIPNDIVKIDLNAELEEEVEGFGRSGIALNSEDEFEADAGDELEDGSSQPSKSGGKKAFDPLQPELAWIPESVVKLGTPLTVEKWEEKQRAKGSRAAAKTTAAKKTRAAKKPDMPVGALNKYVKVIKNIPVVEKDLAPSSSPSSPPRRLSPPPPPLPLSDQNINSLRLTRSAIGAKPISSSKPAVIPAAAKSKQQPPKKSSQPSKTKTTSTTNINPWTLAGSQVSARVTKSHSSTTASQQHNKTSSAQQPIFISSSPAAPVASPDEPPQRASLNTRAATTTPTKRPGAALSTRRLQSLPLTEDDDSFISPFASSPEKSPKLSPRKHRLSPPMSSMSKAGAAAIARQRQQQETTAARAEQQQLGSSPPAVTSLSQPPSPRREPLPFKRTKSEAEANLNNSDNRRQTSIMDYGVRVPKDDHKSAASQNNDPRNSESIVVVLLSSDDEEDDDERKDSSMSFRPKDKLSPPSRERRGPMARAMTSPAALSRSRSAASVDAVGFSDENEDPFGPFEPVGPRPLPSFLSTNKEQARSVTPPASSSFGVGLQEAGSSRHLMDKDGKRGETEKANQKENIKDVRASSTAAKTAAAAAATKTIRKLWIPRTNVEGIGYFDEIEVTHSQQEDDEWNDPFVFGDDRSNGVTKSVQVGGASRKWCEVAVVDLTGEEFD